MSFGLNSIAFGYPKLALPVGPVLVAALIFVVVYKQRQFFWISSFQVIIFCVLYSSTIYQT